MTEHPELLHCSPCPRRGQSCLGSLWTQPEKQQRRKNRRMCLLQQQQLAVTLGLVGSPAPYVRLGFMARSHAALVLHIAFCLVVAGPQCCCSAYSLLNGQRALTGVDLAGICIAFHWQPHSYRFLGGVEMHVCMGDKPRAGTQKSHGQ